MFFFAEITILCFFGVPGGISAKSGLVVNLKQPTKQSLMTITLAIIKTRFDRLDWKIGKQKTEEIDQRETRKHVPVVHMFFLCFPLCFFWHCFLEPFVHSFIRSFVHSFRSIPFHFVSLHFVHSFIWLSHFSLLSRLLCVLNSIKFAPSTRNLRSLRGGTSSLRNFFSEQPLIWLLLLFCSFCSQILLFAQLFHCV